MISGRKMQRLRHAFNAFSAYLLLKIEMKTYSSINLTKFVISSSDKHFDLIGSKYQTGSGLRSL